MGCGCNKKKDNKQLVARAQDKLVAKANKIVQDISKMPLVTGSKKPTKPKK